MIMESGFPSVLMFQEVSHAVLQLWQACAWWRLYNISPVPQGQPHFPLLAIKRSGSAAASPIYVHQYSSTNSGCFLAYSCVQLPNSSQPLVVATTQLESPPAPGSGGASATDFASHCRKQQLHEAFTLLQQSAAHAAASAAGPPGGLMSASHAAQSVPCDVVLGGDFQWAESKDGPLPLMQGWADAWQEWRAAREQQQQQQAADAGATAGKAGPSSAAAAKDAAEEAAMAVPGAPAGGREGLAGLLAAVDARQRQEKLAGSKPPGEALLAAGVTFDLRGNSLLRLSSYSGGYPGTRPDRLLVRLSGVRTAWSLTSLQLMGTRPIPGARINAQAGAGTGAEIVPSTHYGLLLKISGSSALDATAGAATRPAFSPASRAAQQGSRQQPGLPPLAPRVRSRTAPGMLDAAGGWGGGMEVVDVSGDAGPSPAGGKRKRPADEDVIMLD